MKYLNDDSLSRKINISHVTQLAPISFFLLVANIAPHFKASSQMVRVIPPAHTLGKAC